MANDKVIDKIKQEKLKAIKNAFKQIEKTTKKEGMVYILGEKEFTPIPAIPTGFLTFDMALGVGGLARGRVFEFFG